jgi:hypothetical protein
MVTVTLCGGGLPVTVLVQADWCFPWENLSVRCVPETHRREPRGLKALLGMVLTFELIAHLSLEIF